MKYFFHYDSDIPPGMGVPNFSPTHLASLMTTLAVLTAAALEYSRLSHPTKSRIMRALAVALLGLEAARTIWAVSVGHYPVNRMLPLHLCGIMVFIEFFAVFTGKRFLKEFSYCSGLPGALMALITPEPSGYPFLSFQHLQSLFVHALLVSIPVLWIAGDGFRPDIRNLPKCFALLLGLTGMNAVVNTVLHSNYMFICRAPADTPLAVFDQWVGHPWYVGLVLVCVVVVWTVMYALWMVAAAVGAPKRSSEFNAPYGRN